MMWAIEVTLDGCGVPLELCRCVQPEAVSAVVLALCRAKECRPLTIRRIPDAPDLVATGANPWPEEL